MSRLMKQLIYGLGFIIFFGALGFWWYALFLKPAPSCFDNVQNQNETGVDCGGACSSFCMSDVKPLEQIGEAQVFFLASGGIGLFVKFQNPNSMFAAERFDYTFRVRGMKNILLETSGNAFASAGELGYVALFATPAASFTVADVDTVEFSMKEPVWVTADKLPRSRFRVQNVQTTADMNGFTITGRLTNDDTVPLRSVQVAALLKDRYGYITGVSFTSIDRILPADTVSFTITHPPLSSVQPSDTQIVVKALR